MDKNVAIVTGAGQGLGEKIARKLHASGYRVCITDMNEDNAKSVAASLDASGDTAFGYKLDVRSKDAFIGARDAIIEKWGSANVLVNNAAQTRVASVMDITPEDFDDILSINLRGTFLACQVFGQHFADQGYGRIVNMASLAGQNGGSATGAHYAASKGGIATLTKVFARDLASKGVTVNAISPGPLDLPIVRKIVPADKLAGIIQNIPVQTLGNPDFIADAVMLFVSPAAASATGACLDINGGLYMR